MGRLIELKADLKFLGTYDSSYQYSKGDVVYKDGMTQCFDGEKFVKFGTTGRAYPYESPLPKRVLPKTCARCGAPVNSYRTKCEYCGCEY